MERDPASWLFTALAVGSLAVVAFTTEQQSWAATGREKHRDPGLPPQRTDAGAGHDAGVPSEIPARGWWAIAKRVAGNVSEHRLLTEAAGITFYALLAIFPALAALVSLYGLFADPATISDNIGAVSGVVPGGGMEIITDQLHALATDSSKKLGFGVALGLATSLWSSNQGTKALFDALNVV
jgi:membrane protein